MKKEYALEFLLEYLFAVGGLTTAFAVYLAALNNDTGYLSIIEYSVIAVFLGNIICAAIKKLSENRKNCI